MLSTLYPLLILLLIQLTTSIPFASTITLTGPTAAPTPTSPSYTSDNAFRTSCLNSTNTFRHQHNATALTWNSTLVASASALASRCEFKHSGGLNGENIAAGYSNVTATIDAWGNERKKYDFGGGEFDEDTGHFTQLVWKATTSVGCARAECEDIGWFVVCQYWPPGNFKRGYEDQVQKQESGASG